MIPFAFATPYPIIKLSIVPITAGHRSMFIHHTVVQNSIITNNASASYLVVVRLFHVIFLYQSSRYDRIINQKSPLTIQPAKLDQGTLYREWVPTNVQNQNKTAQGSKTISHKTRMIVEKKKNNHLRIRES